MDELDKTDILRERLQASYEECQEALKVCEGDLLGALAWIEHSRREKGNSLTGVVSQAVTKAQEVSQGSILDRLRVRVGDHVVADWPVMLAGAGAAAVAVLGVLLKQVSLETHVQPHPKTQGEEESQETESPS